MAVTQNSTVEFDFDRADASKVIAPVESLSYMLLNIRLSITLFCALQRIPTTPRSLSIRRGSR
jgi:hypothetical protein